MNKLFAIIIFVAGFTLSLRSQEMEETTPVVEKDKPVRSPWASAYLIDNQTTFIPVKNTFEYVIQHKFGTVKNGLDDLYGIYAPGANIRLGLNFVPIKNFQVGWGITKKNMYNDFSAKWTIIEQTRKNTIPVTVTLYGVAAIDGRSKDYFTSQQYYHSSDPVGPMVKHTFRPSARYSYFSQILISRKFSEAITFQAGASFTHYNLVAKTGDHDKIGAHFAGRIKFSPQSSFIFNYDLPLKIKQISEQREWKDHPTSNLACGLEVATTSHAFQIYLGSADGIIPQDQMLFNQGSWKNKGFAVGFVITRIWNF
jgi:hypothetical protein